MVEYIFTATETDEKLFSFRNGYRERIVRCKDCIYGRKEHAVYEDRDTYYEQDRWYCGAWVNGEHLVYKEGFCAWGERRQDD